MSEIRIMNTDGLREFEIWSEGWSGTGDGGNAYLVGKGYGTNFYLAVINYFERWPNPNFNKETLTLWGCGLFPNKRFAKESFG